MTVDRGSVTAVLVTRGDVDLQPILDSLIFPSVVVWDNSCRDDLGAYGRYEAVRTLTETPLVYVQDDDCVVTPEAQAELCALYEIGYLLSNMDPHHNGGGMPHLALPGWGAMFERSMVEVAFSRWRHAHPDDYGSDDFNRIGCDIVFPVLTPSVTVNLGHENLPYAWAANRTHVQPGYHARKRWYYERACALR